MLASNSPSAKRSLAVPRTIRVAIIGASGYAGAELTRILLAHPHASITGLYGKSAAGQEIAALFPQFAGYDFGAAGGTIRPVDTDAIAKSADVAFVALPHGEAANVVAELFARDVAVLDLSADFRLHALGDYEPWYGAHRAPALVGRAVYGLPELHREAIAESRLVAVPGCFPTATILAIAPLLAARAVSPEGIIVDAKSGVSGAGRTPGPNTHYVEVTEGIRAYKVAAHRHTPEIEQELSLASNAPIRLLFTPYLTPMSRGILSTVYGHAANDATTASVRAILREKFAHEPFVAIVDTPPDTLHVRGTNRVHISAWVDARTRRVIAMAAIDNLVKGAAGQAVQCFNIMHAFAEQTAL